MSRVLVSGLINIETTLRIDSFPIDYSPVRYPFFGVNSTVSGVGYNVARALTVLGDSVDFLSIIGRDLPGRLVREALAKDGIPDAYVIESAAHTAQSVILYDPHGKRAIHVDLKDLQEQVYPAGVFERALAACDVSVLCNINFSRPFLRQARQAGKLVATDVHAISSLDDDYNRDFMANADVLFMSDERLPTTPEEWARAVLGRFGGRVVVIGLGSQGALLALRDEGFIGRFPAAYTRPVVSTIGAGDALFSAFVHLYSRKFTAFEALKRAIVFASYKIGVAGAADGFADAGQLERLYADSLARQRHAES